MSEAQQARQPLHHSSPPPRHHHSAQLSMHTAAAVILAFVRIVLAATVNLPDPTIQLVNNCPIAVQPYFTGTNPGGLPNPGLLQPGASASYSVA
jgi:hypothetical protein